MSSLTVTYTSVYSSSEPWRFQWVSDDELEAPEEASQFPEQAPPSPDYVPRPEHPPSPDYMPGPEHPPSPDYVPGPEYPKYLVPSDDEVPIEDQPLPADASPTTLSPGYVADFDPSEEDHEEDPAEYPADGGDDDDDEDEEEEEHLALTDSTTLPAVDHGPSAEDTEVIETDESTPTPPVPSPRLRRARISVRPQTPMSATTEALIATVIVALPSSPPPSLLTLLSSPLPQIPSPPLPIPSPPTHTSLTYLEAPLGYRAAMIRSSVASPLPLPAPSSPLLLPATDCREDVTEANVPPRKRLCLTAPAPRFEVGESSAAVAARQPGLDVTPVTNYSFVDIVDATPGRPMSIEVGYGITDVWDDMVGDMEGRAPTTLEELSQRVTDLAATLARDTHEMYVRFKDAQDNRALQRA
ncbi:hypothetical protein Tco_1469051 [Tanacetum coccineum]